MCQLTTALHAFDEPGAHGIVETDFNLVGANELTIEVSFDGGAHWLEVQDGEVFSTSHPGSEGLVRYTVHRQEPTEQSFIAGYAYYYW